MKTKLFMLFTLLMIIGLDNGCSNSTQNKTSVPSPEDIQSIRFQIQGSENVAIIVSKDKIRYLNDNRAISIDTSITDSQEFNLLLSSFNLATFWALEDRINIGNNIPIISLAVSANPIRVINNPDNNEKELQYTEGEKYSSLTALQSELELLRTRLKERFQ